jgi:hypothetical protein
MMWRSFDLGNHRLVIVPDARNLLLHRAADIREGCVHSLFGFLPLDVRPAPLERDRLQKVFGFAELTVWNTTWTLRDIAVDWMPLCRTSLRAKFSDADSHYFRNAIWQLRCLNPIGRAIGAIDWLF